MKKIEIFDPAMCCPTGLCGPNINPDLMRIAAVLETLKRQGITVERHNLRDEPQLYVSNKTVRGCGRSADYHSRGRNRGYKELSNQQAIKRMDGG